MTVHPLPQKKDLMTEKIASNLAGVLILLANEVAVPLPEKPNFLVFLLCRFSLGHGQRSSSLLTILEYGTLEQKILIDGI